MRKEKDRGKNVTMATRDTSYKQVRRRAGMEIIAKKAILRMRWLGDE